MVCTLLILIGGEAGLLPYALSLFHLFVLIVDLPSCCVTGRLVRQAMRRTADFHTNSITLPHYHTTRYHTVNYHSTWYHSLGITLPHYHISYHTVTLPLYHTITLPHYHSITLTLSHSLYHCITPSLYHATILSHYHTVTL